MDRDKAIAFLNVLYMAAGEASLSRGDHSRVTQAYQALGEWVQKELEVSSVEVASKTKAEKSE